MAASGATPIILYHSTTAAAVPSNTNLAAGELGLNIADMKLYCENDSAVVTLLASADAAAGNFTTVDTTNLEVTNIKAKDGTASATITDSTGAFTISTELSVDNININGNTIVSSDTDGDLNLTPNGTGDLVLDGLKWPQADGSADYVLSTDGAGQLSWAAQTGGGGGGGTSVTVTQATATAAQTDFSVTYTVGQLSVYLNGALLASGDFTASNGTTVVLAAGAALNDIFTAVAYSTVAGLEIESATPFMTAVGSDAGAVNTGVNNVFVGFEAGNDNTTGTNNTAVGYQALDACTTGGTNVAVGANALGSHTSPSSSTAIGTQALTTLTGGAGSSTAVGYRALYLNETGISNTAVGTSCMWNNTASNNTAVGDSAMFANTTGGNNTAMGAGALDTNTTGAENTALGYLALTANTTASNNTALGRSALQANTTGANNIAIGSNALDANTTASNIIAIGLNAFGSANRTLDTSSAGVAIGTNAGTSVTTAYGSLIIGENSGVSYATGVFGMYVGVNTTASAGGAVDEMVIGTRGGTGKGDGTGFINPNTGPVYQGNNSSSWSTVSDQRIKKNIVDNTEGLEIISQLRVCNFEYRLPEEVDPELKPSDAVGRTGVQLGVIAQELQQVCPDCVTQQTTGVLSVDTDEIFWHMVNAIKELSAKCDSLQAEINTLKGQ
jgi:hypothetical protein